MPFEKDLSEFEMRSAKALAMGADAVSIGTAALIALDCNRPIHVADYAALGTVPGACHHCQNACASDVIVCFKLTGFKNDF